MYFRSGSSSSKNWQVSGTWWSKKDGIWKSVIEQERVKGTFDQRTRDVKFGIGDIVLLWDKLKGKPKNNGKLEKIWMGPYRVSSIAGKGSVYLDTLHGDEFELPMNGGFC